MEITNVGNAPAIEVLIDAEIELRYSSINNEKRIPARHAPDMIPYIQSCWHASIIRFLRPYKTHSEVGYLVSTVIGFICLRIFSLSNSTSGHFLMVYVK
jgi:hypothetical protein